MLALSFVPCDVVDIFLNCCDNLMTQQDHRHHLPRHHLATSSRTFIDFKTSKKKRERSDVRNRSILKKSVLPSSERVRVRSPAARQEQLFKPASAILKVAFLVSACQSS
jgi:hypothetical protein